jgi:hypothetical protein
MTRSAFIGTAGLLLAGALIATLAGGRQSSPAAPSSPEPAPAPTAAPARVDTMKPAPPGPLPPLPRVDFEPVRPMPVVHEVYEFAARHPEVLQYVPCYCGCERAGHNGNHDCFVKSRASTGHIVEWDAHGLGCAICLEVGRRAMTLFNEKKSVSEIRATIDREFGSHAATQTPTPHPPHEG